MQNRKIEFITEAFSMQPRIIAIKGRDWQTGFLVDRLEHEYKKLAEGRIEVIRGYVDDVCVIEYLERSVNIHYIQTN